MRFDENFNVSLSLNPKREMIKVMKKYLLVSLLALLAFVGKAQEDNSDIVKVGDTMPSFTIVSDNGSKLQSASLKGKVILVNFFATWCPPCQKELAAVQQTLWPKYMIFCLFVFFYTDSLYIDLRAGAHYNSTMVIAVLQRRTG